MTPLTTEELEEAHAALPAELKDTPMICGRTPGLMMKLETLQPTGAYKIRAAWTALSRLADKGRERGVALSSSGNFAGAFTWAAHRQGIPAHLVFTPSVSGLKVRLAESFPCTIHRCEDRYEARYELLQSLGEQGIITIDHRIDRNVYLGHGTIGWECADRMDEFQRVLLPLSTGGLAIGVASALRLEGFKGQILGIQPAGNLTLYQSWLQGHPVRMDRAYTCCDALTATSVPQEAFDMLRSLIDGVLQVSEVAVKRAVAYLIREEGLVAEPGAAVGMAAILEEQVPAPGTLLVLSGRNIEDEMLRECLSA